MRALQRGVLGWAFPGTMWLAFAWMAIAAPPLTTVEDVLYKADGTRFKGVAYVEWKSFTASDYSNIAMNTVNVKINEGVLKVQLVPTTTASPGAYYSVRYFSEGKAQFAELWSVPPSPTPLRVKDVRMAAGGGAVAPVTGPVLITDVTGLTTELSARPIKGTGFVTSRVAMINPSGGLDGVTGNLTDCVRADGTTGPCGGGSISGPGFVDSETPAGTVNGSNQVFSLANVPSPPESLELYRNGLLMKNGLDYSASGIAVTFAAGATPQTGDVLLASYRLANPGNPTGSAGGALSGNYPNPSIAAGAVSNLQVATGAGISESKLTLNFPTHSNTNDPTAGEKSALTGTAGTASGSNRYVTDQDSRLADARNPLGHALLSPAHSDTTAAGVVRGDVMVAQGSGPATWRRLALGAPNRCLMSNGSDAMWNTCLFTGYLSGSVPFVDAAGNLAQNNARFFWDDNNRRLGIGSGSPASTLYVHDALTGTGTTGVTVRAGQGQGFNPLQVWLDASGTELGRVESDGVVSAPAVRGTSSSTRAGWRDAGTASDPSTRANGDAWLNTTQQARKTQEAGQVHATPQVICASTGIGSSATSMTRLGSCAIPAGFLSAGDRVEIHAAYTHEGSAIGFSTEVRWASSLVLARSAAAGEIGLAAKISAGVHSGGAAWSTQSWGSTLSIAASLGNAADAVSSGIVIDFLGSMAGVTTETVTLRNFTVIRYPAQANP